MALLNRSQLLGAVQLKRETVEVPELGGSVIVQELTAGERDQYEMALYEKGKDEKAPKDYIRASLVACSVVDESGAKLFTLDDVPALAKLSATALDRIVDAARKLSGLNAEDKEAQVKN